MSVTTRSQSTKILKYLKTNKANKKFTAAELINELKPQNVSSGAVSGLIAKLHKLDLLKSEGMRPKNYYINGDLNSYRTRKLGSIGSKAGRTITRQKITETHLIITPLEMMVDTAINDLTKLKLALTQMDISAIPTSTLLHELTTRIKESN